MINSVATAIKQMGAESLLLSLYKWPFPGVSENWIS